MRSITRSLLLFAVMSVLLIACYPRVQVLARFPNGKVKVARHRALFDSLREVYITYYDNGKKKEADYWRNRHKTWAPGNIYGWYESGAKEWVSITKYKDTALVYNPEDSTYTFKGLCYNSTESRYENGKLHFKTTIENGKHVNIYNNEKGDSLTKEVMGNVRPDGYDTMRNSKMYNVK